MHSRSSCCGSRPPVKCVIVWIDARGDRVRGQSDRVRGTQHLTGIVGMKERIVLVESFYQLVDRANRLLGRHLQAGVGYESAIAAFPALDAIKSEREQSPKFGFGHVARRALSLLGDWSEELV